MTKSIPLSRGYVALVDDEDYAALAAYKWYVCVSSNTCYAIRRSGPEKRTLYMHREILVVPKGVLVDHADGNGLNNTRANLRPATHSQNHANQKKPNNRGVSFYKGVGWARREGCWRARLTIGGKDRCLGYFRSEEAAARAYDAEARRVFGKFALVNFRR